MTNTIKAIGVGNVGCTIVTNMFDYAIKGIHFTVCDIDTQLLNKSTVPDNIQLKILSDEDSEHLFDLQSDLVLNTILDVNTKMVLVMAEMGGTAEMEIMRGIAQLAKGQGIITVGIVSIPFLSEGELNHKKALLDIEKLRKMFDSIIVIDNNKSLLLSEVILFERSFPVIFKAFTTVVRGIASLLSDQLFDLGDIKTVLCNNSSTYIGSAIVSGDYRAKNAIESAIYSPLLKCDKIANGNKVLLFIASGISGIDIDEIAVINDVIVAHVGRKTDIHIGVTEDGSLGESIMVSLIATGIDVSEN